jgi:MerR family transcriptional regulator, light-induced transcriptional regulator
MQTLLSPRQVALAMGVSESSLKRWCDRGLMQTRRTAGGHRRVPIDSVMQFVRDSGQPLPRPELLGLPSTTGKGSLVLDRAVEQMVQALETGDEELATRVVFDLYLAHQSATDICDKVIAVAFQQIGDDWECGGIEVYQERRGCEVCLRTLFALRSAMTLPKANAPRAIGGTFSNDAYHLPTTMVEIALREANWRAESLGTNLTADTICAAIRNEKPRLIWLSASHIVDPKLFLTEYAKVADAAAAENVAIAVGGRALVPELRQQMDYAAYCDNLRHLTALAKSLAPKGAAASARKSRGKSGKNAAD